MPKKKSTIISEHSDKPLASKERHYVNNGDFLKALVERKASVMAAKEAGLEKPRVSNYIGECILKIAENLGKKRNFAGYRFKDEMVFDGIEVCLKYIDNFDPAKSTNPFSYFTQICTFAFINRISIEQKQTYIRFKSALNSAVLGELAEFGVDSDHEHILDNVQFQNDYMEEYIASFEEKKLPKKAVEKKGLEVFIEDTPETSLESSEDVSTAEAILPLENDSTPSESV